MSDAEPSLGVAKDTPRNRRKKKKSHIPDWMQPNHYGYEYTAQDGYDAKTGLPKKPKKSYNNPHGLNERLGNAQIQGVLELFGDDPILAGAREAASVAGGKPFTANQVMYLFDHAQPDIRANIQDMMYRAGFYPKRFHPYPGSTLTTEDRAAFKKFMTGVAANPGQGGIAKLLQQSAQDGDTMGSLQDNSVYKPLVRTITNPMDIQNTANQVGKALHGTYLSAEQMKVFTSAYQTMEKAFQEQQYTAEGGDLASGWVDPDNATSQTITEPASVGAQAEQLIRTQDTNDFKANTFTDRLNVILDSLRGPGGSTQVGPM